MKELTATDARKNLFKVLEEASYSMPTRVHYKKGDGVVVSYRQYLGLIHQKKRKKGPLEPLVQGKIVGSLDQNTGKKLLKYMGIK